MIERLATLNSEVCKLARRAGEKIMPFYQPGIAVTWKKDAFPSTAADMASHDFVVESLPLIGLRSPQRRGIN